MGIKSTSPWFPLCSWNCGETGASEPREDTDVFSYRREERWGTTGRLCLRQCSSPALLFSRDRGWVLHARLTAGPFTGSIFFFFGGAGLCESLHSSHSSHESSLKLEPSWSAQSLGQAEVLLWPRKLGKWHCDKVASYLTAFLLK